MSTAGGDMDINLNVEEAGLDELNNLTLEDIKLKIKVLENDIRYTQNETKRLTHEINGEKYKIKENEEKIKLHKNLPWLVGHVVEVIRIKNK